MVRGNLPAHTPLVPRESFVAIDFIYRFLLGADVDLRVLEGQTVNPTLSITSSTVLISPNQLRFNMAPFKSYKVEARLIVSANVKLRHYGPAAPTRVQLARKQIEAATLVAALDTAYSAADIVATPAAIIELSGIVYNGSTAGFFGISWAQAVSNATPSTIFAGSSLQYSSID